MLGPWVLYRPYIYYLVFEPCSRLPVCTRSSQLRIATAPQQRIRPLLYSTGIRVVHRSQSLTRISSCHQPGIEFLRTSSSQNLYCCGLTTESDDGAGRRNVASRLYVGMCCLHVHQSMQTDIYVLAPLRQGQCVHRHGLAGVDVVPCTVSHELDVSGRIYPSKASRASFGPLAGICPPLTMRLVSFGYLFGMRMGKPHPLSRSGR